MLVAGLGGCGAALLAAAPVHGFWPLAGAARASPGCSGRASSRRAGARSCTGSRRRSAASRSAIRQTAIPISGFAIVARPAADRRAPAASAGASRRSGSPASPARPSAASCCAKARSSTTPRRPPAARRSATGGIWRLSLGSALVLAPQLCVAGFTVLFLHEQPRPVRRRGGGRARRRCSCSPIGGRIGAGPLVGRRRESRLAPLRAIALAAGGARRR